MKDAQYLYSLPKRPKLRSLLANQNGKGYELIEGGIWKGDSDCRFGRLGKGGCIRHLSSKSQRERSIDNTKKGDELIFPVADSTAKLSGRDYEFRKKKTL